MNKLFSEFVAAIFLVCAPVFGNAYACSDCMARNYDRLANIENIYQDGTQKTKAIRHEYEDMVAGYRSDERIRKLSDDELEWLYRSSNMAAFYAQDIRYVNDMAFYTEALQKRGRAYDRHYRDLYDAYMSARMFDEAEALRKRYALQDVEVVPKIKTQPQIQGDPRAFLVDKEDGSLSLRSVDLKSGSRIVVVSHPLCHFSADAIHAIATHVELKKLFDHYAIWLVPPSRKMELDIIRPWSAGHSDGSTMLAYSREDWPMITSWDTPTFFFLKEGHVIDVVAGWPGQGREAALEAALRKIGLDPAK